MHLNYMFMIKDIPVVARALIITLELTVASYIGAIILGSIFGFILMRGNRILRIIVVSINTFIKGLPLVIQLLFCYYAIPYIFRAINDLLGIAIYNSKKPPYFLFAVIAFSFNYGAYMTDVVVSSFKAVDSRQMEAVYSVGMSRFQGFVNVVLPQAIVNAGPDLCNYVMWLLKATSLASIVNVFEMLSVAKASTAENYAILEGYIVAAALYWIVCIFAEKLFARINNTLDYRIQKES